MKFSGHLKPEPGGHKSGQGRHWPGSSWTVSWSCMMMTMTMIIVIIMMMMMIMFAMNISALMMMIWIYWECVFLLVSVCHFAPKTGTLGWVMGWFWEKGWGNGGHSQRPVALGVWWVLKGSHEGVSTGVWVLMGNQKIGSRKDLAGSVNQKTAPISCVCSAHKSQRKMPPSCLGLKSASWRLA